MYVLGLVFVHIDKIKDQVFAKVAMQAADLYADALSNMQVGSIRSMWDKVSHAIPHCSISTNGMLAGLDTNCCC